MKKRILITLARGIFCLYFANNVFAEVEYSWDEVYGRFFKLENSAGTEKYEFGLNEIPWVNIFIPKEYFGGDSHYLLSIIGERWYKDGRRMQGSFSFWHGGDDRDFTLHEPFKNWDRIKGASDNWTYNWALICIGRPGSYAFAHASADFSVTPEPLSSILFLVGAAPLAYFRYRKKKSARA